MKKLLLAFLFVATNIAFAQNAMADLKFEEAEIAFNNQDYETTIAKLDEFDKVFGSVTSKSLYLRIVSQDKLYDYEDLQSDVLPLLNKNVKSYLKGMQNEGLDDKYKTVYKISQNVYNAYNQSTYLNLEEIKNIKKELELKNYQEAIKWYKKAIAKGDITAYYGIAYILYVEEKKPTEAFEWAKKGAEMKNLSSLTFLGALYWRGEGTTKNLTNAFKVLKEGAEGGSALSSLWLANMYINGLGIDKSYEEAFKWYSNAAFKGNAAAMYELALLYSNKGLSFYDLSKHQYWLNKAAEKNYTDAFRTLGVNYEKGYGVTVDYAEAMKWYLKAADNKDHKAMRLIGDLYLNSKGVKIDSDKVIEWYTKAANLGNQEASNLLPSLYCGIAQSLLTIKDYTKALNTYIKAHELGCKEAKYKIAEIYKNGLGVPKDKKLAKEWENK